MKIAANSTLVGRLLWCGHDFFGFLFLQEVFLAGAKIMKNLWQFLMKNVFGLNEGGKVTLNGVKIGRVERFFIGDALEDEFVPVMIEINRKLVDRHRVEAGNEIFNNDGSFKDEILPFLWGS